MHETQDQSGLSALQALLPPPDRPHLGEVAWEELFARLGTRLPAEYVALMETYGSGVWNGCLLFPRPMELDQATLNLRDAFGRVKARLSAVPQHPDRNPSFWPDPGGFLMFAGSDEGDYLGWLTTGAPDDWPVVAIARHARDAPPFEHGITDTLLQWLRGRLEHPGLPVTDTRAVSFDPHEPVDE